jgi:Bacterial self-protective colicin-like immunity
MHPTVHRDIVKAFLDEKLSTNEFIKLYLTVCKEGEKLMVESLYEIISKFFWAVEDFHEDVTPEEEAQDPFSITEVTMRKRLAAALDELDQFLSTYNGDYFEEPSGKFLEHLQQVEKNRPIYELVDTINHFLKGNLSALKFKEFYLEGFRAEKPGILIEPLAKILKSVATSLENYGSPEDGATNLTEEKLRETIKQVADSLDNLLRQIKGNYYLTETEAANLQPTEFARL